MIYGLLCPDDLSTKIFNKGFTKALTGRGDTVYTISPVVFGFEKEAEGLGATHLDIRMSRFINPFSDVNYIFRLARILKEKQVETLITWTTKPNVYGPIAAKIAGVPRVVCAVRGLGRVFMDPASIKARLVQNVLMALYRNAANISDFVWFTNPNDMKFFIGEGVVSQEKALLTKNGVDMEFYNEKSMSEGRAEHVRNEFQIGPDDKVVLMVGRMIYPKGVSEFAEASRIFYRENSKVKFILVAPLEKNSPQAMPESFLNKYLENGNFIYVPFRKDIRDLYAICDISVLPSYYMEGGYPRALLEAMSFSKPVITTDTKGCRGAVDDGENGFLVPSRDARALADAIGKIIDDDALARKFGENSYKKMCKEFDENIFIKTVLDRLKAE